MNQFQKFTLVLMFLVYFPLSGNTLGKVGTFGPLVPFQERQQIDTLRAYKISEDPFIRQLHIKTNRHNQHNPIEKAYLHTDKDLFSVGETIWYSIYVAAGPFHQYTNGSRVIHVDLIDPEGNIVLSQTHALVNGQGFGSLKIPNKLTEGNYQLRAYTQWMRNSDADFFYTKALRLLNERNTKDSSHINEDEIDLQFLPEGGHLVSGIPSKVSFKAVGSDGLPRNLKGNVLDASGNRVSTFTTFDRGAGFFQLLPKKEGQYLAVLENGSEYPLPEILDKGYTLAVDNLGEKSIWVIVQASELLRDKPFYILGHMRQKKYYHGRFEFGPNTTFTFEIPKTKMPSGVLTLTLFDSDQKPWCERAVFVNNQEELVITTKISNKKLAKRDKVVLDVKVTDSEGKPIVTKLSMAVTDAGQVKKKRGAGTILSQFLLESELKGHISEPGLLFKNQKRTTSQLADLVMLTRGWRKYHWPEVWEGSKTTKEFNFAEGLIVSGKATRSNKKPMPNATLNVIAKSGDLLGMLSAKTALDGRFLIPDFNYSGPTELVFNAHNYKGKPLDVKVILDPNKINLPPTQYKSPLLKKTEEVENYSTHSVARQRMNTVYESKKVTELDEVVVTEKKKESARNQTPSVYGQNPDATLYAADHIALQTVLQLVGLFPGITVNGSTVSIRNRGTPLWVLDGIPVYNDNPSGMNAALAAQRAARSPDNPNPPLNYTVAHAVAPGPVPSSIANMDTFTVERVEILKGVSAAIYGSRGSNGVILIYTKRGEGQTVKSVLSPDFTISGHAAQKEFYSPKYDIKREEHIAPDYRATLYWNPNFTTNEYGNAKIEFFNSDSAKEIQVSIEGLSPYGIPGAYLETFGN